jgi:hypothetical protein
MIRVALGVVRRFDNGGWRALASSCMTVRHAD